MFANLSNLFDLFAFYPRRYLQRAASIIASAETRVLNSFSRYSREIGSGDSKSGRSTGAGCGLAAGSTRSVGGLTHRARFTHRSCA